MVQPVLRVATAEDLQRVLDFGAAVFCSHEPMCQALRPTPAEFVGQFAPLVEACCTSGLSYLVELHEKQDDSSKRTIVSMSLALPYDAYKAVSDQLPENTIFNPVLAVFDALERLPCSEASEAVLNFMWATHEQHTNRGYAKRVVEGTETAAKQAGFSWLVADVTNVISQHMAALFGYQELIKVRYHDHEHFKSIQSTQHVMRVVKQLTTDAAVDERDQGLLQSGRQLSQGSKMSSSSLQHMLL